MIMGGGSRMAGIPMHLLCDMVKILPSFDGVTGSLIEWLGCFFFSKKISQ